MFCWWFHAWERPNHNHPLFIRPPWRLSWKASPLSHSSLSQRHEESAAHVVVLRASEDVGCAIEVRAVNSDETRVLPRIKRRVEYRSKSWTLAHSIHIGYMRINPAKSHCCVFRITTSRLPTNFYDSMSMILCLILLIVEIQTKCLEGWNRSVKLKMIQSFLLLILSFCFSADKLLRW